MTTVVDGFEGAGQSGNVPAGGGDEDVLDAVRGGIAVTQHADTEVVQSVGVFVVDRRKS